MHSNALIDTNQRLSDVQFSQIMASLSDLSLWSPGKAFHYHHSLRKRRSNTAAVRSVPSSFWNSPRLRHWSSTDESTLSIILGNFHARFVMRNICVDVIEQLQEAEVPVLFALKIPQENDAPTNLSSHDLLKYIVRQALQVRQKRESEKSMALRCATFNSASTDSEWFQVLAAVLAEIETCIYIVIDLEMLDRNVESTDGFSWAQAFESFFTKLRNRGLSTKLKVLLVSYGSLPFQLSPAEHSKFVISAKTRLTTARQRKAGRGIRTPQVPFRLKNLPGSPVKVGAGRAGRHRT